MLDREKIGKQIANRRKNLGMTQKQFADMLHISCQAVSRWESGTGLPSIDLLCDIATVLDISVDTLLSGDSFGNTDVSYKDTGLDIVRLYTLKDKLQKLATQDERIVYNHYIDPVIFKIDVNRMEEPVFLLITNVPGSKARMAREMGYDSEICADLTARAINNIVRFGAKPVVLQAHIVCGNCSGRQILSMGEAFQRSCEASKVMFAGFEISGQPVNYRADEYELSVGIVGVADRKELLTRDKVQDNDVLIAMMNEGIDAVSYPFVKVLLERNVALKNAKIDDNHIFIDEILKPNLSYANVVAALMEQKLLHGLVRISNSVVSEHLWTDLPEGLGACINLSAVPLPPLYRFIYRHELIGRKFIPYRFSLGVGMIAVVPKDRAQEALETIRSFHDSFVIGEICRIHEGDNKVWAEGEVRW